ncbi:DNA polymerase [Vreelandella massiliensis]|uniref:DNA polymerase n=1 Tax=Vreelandella massiliensis TaxID=1816686 RepID=UPI00096ABF38|nr:DNA polymerase [Halomonas massiliensis]
MRILGIDHDLITLDFETYYGTGCSLSLQSMNTFNYLAHPDFSIHGVGIKINDADTEWVAPDEIVDRLDEIFDGNGRPTALLAHNTNFDAFILHHFWDIHPDLYLDTLAMSRGMFPGRKHGLKQLAERLWPNDPSMRKGEELVNFRNVTTNALYDNDAMLQSMIDYCIQDVDLTHAAFVKMLPYYPEDELELIHLTTQMMCEPMFVLDRQLITEARDGWIAERQAKIEAAGVAESTLNSNPKFEKALTSRGVKIIHKADLRTGKMKPALGKADLGFQQMRAAHPDLDHLFEGRVAAKSVTQIRRAERFLETAEITGGTMPMPLKYYSAATGRYGGGELLNVQNMNRGSALRKALCAPPGYLVAVADSSNIEARMLAWLAGQQELLDVFRSGGDVYSFFASKLYGFEVNKADHPHERFVGKVSVLALGYSQGWRRFQEGMAAGMLGGDPVLFSDAEAQEVVNTYRGVNYMIPQYWKQAQQAIVDMYMGNEYDWGPLRVARNALIMPNGMALQYPGLRPDDDGGFEYYNGNFYTRLYGGKCVENICQALSRIVLFDQMLDINRYVTQHDGRVVLNVHDEIIAIVPEATAERDFDKMLEIMKQPPAWCADLPLDAEGGTAREYSK